MYLVEPQTDIPAWHCPMKAGVRYVVSQAIAAKALTLAECEIQDLGRQLASDTPKPLCAADRVLVCRDGAYGDLLFMTPALLKLKEVVGCEVTVSAMADYWQILDHLGLGYLGAPMPFDLFATFDRHIWLNEVLLFGEQAQTTHAVDLFAQVLGVTLEPEERVCHYALQNGERLWAEREWPRSCRKRLVVCPAASQLARTMPAAWWTDFFRLTLNDGWEVFVLGRHGDIALNDVPFIRNLTHPRCSYTFRQSAAVMTTADVVVGVDSALLHVAGALGLPAVGLFSTHPPMLRSAYHTSIVPVQGQTAVGCAPCFHNGRAGDWVEGMPCKASGRCEALAGLSHGDVWNLCKEASK